VTEIKQLCYFSIQSPFISTHTDTLTLPQMALYIPRSIFHLARLLYVRPETFGPTLIPLYLYLYHYPGVIVGLNNNNNNNNNNNIYLTAIGLSPGGSGFLTRIQERVVILLLNLRREGYMRCT
jgi:hypothetical protein